MSDHILQPLWMSAASGEDRPIFHWRDFRGRPRGSVGTKDLVRGFAGIAQQLRARGLEPGARVMLVYPPSLDFVLAFGGCLWAGVIPVPTYPPVPGVEADERRLQCLAETAGCRLALTNRRFRWLRRLGTVQRLVRGGKTRAKRLAWWVTDHRLRADAPTPPAPASTDDDAFLQFTSGSTSQPKGVRITHGNLAHQLADNRRALGLGPDTRAVLWVPQYHDLGLISGILSGLVGNGEAWFMSPLTFLRDPGQWFDVLTEVRGTHTAAPNFAFDFLLDRTTPKRRARWDLSSMRVVMSAAEPIRPTTVRRFLDALAPAGLPPEAFCAAYGLAEHTVGVTVWGHGSLRVDPTTREQSGRVVEDPGGVEVHACGKPGPDIQLSIVDPDTRRALPDGTVGEIWVDSPSKAAGYWGMPELSAQTFEAKREGSAARWLRTGDLGFVRDGELFVTGRLKDLIIIDGRNIAPEDLEQVVRSDSRIRPGGIAAFSLHDERACVVAEVRDEKLAAPGLEQLAQQLVEQLRVSWPIPLSLVLAPPRAVPRTTSGKVQRGATRRAFERGQLPILLRTQSGDPIGAAQPRANHA